jgi:protein-disulfide isomerase
MRAPTTFALGVATVVVVALTIVFAVTREGDDDGPVVADSADEASALVREDSHVLGEEGDGDVTFVEFLDFECEACLAAYPFVEQAREEYAGRVTFVVRYFPLPGHANAEPAARAVEAAARQDRFEEMYQQMYATQTSWGEQQQPMDDLFRGFAEDLGLDMAQFDADYASPEVLERVRRDVADGRSLGVQGTPTFFVNGEPFQPQSGDDFSRVLDAALAE